MKIEPDLKRPQYIQGVWGVGYKLVSPEWQGPVLQTEPAWSAKLK